MNSRKQSNFNKNFFLEILLVKVHRTLQIHHMFDHEFNFKNFLIKRTIKLNNRCGNVYLTVTLSSIARAIYYDAVISSTLAVEVFIFNSERSSQELQLLFTAFKVTFFYLLVSVEV